MDFKYHCTESDCKVLALATSFEEKQNLARPAENDS